MTAQLSSPSPAVLQPGNAGQPTSEARDSEAILQAAIAILAQGAELVSQLDAADYAQRVPAVFNASIGGHYRHCLDHFSSFIAGIGLTEINYDHRQRDRRIETDPGFALDVTRTFIDVLEGLDPALLVQPTTARCEVSYSHGHSPAARTSVGRELVYCIAHAIHHYALIAVMAKLMEIELPPHFGVAPSTVTYERTRQ